MSKAVATNRKARHNYHIVETYEVGIELKGNEVKSLRTKSCTLSDSFARIERGELFLYNAHIPEFEKSSFFRPEPTRTRKLLAHKKEIKKLESLTVQRGLTLIPTKVYFNQQGRAKVEIALARGKHTFDKRKKLKDDITERETQRALKRFRKG